MASRIALASPSSPDACQLRLVRVQTQTIDEAPVRPVRSQTAQWPEDLAFFALSYVSGLIIFFGMIV